MCRCIADCESGPLRLMHCARASLSLCRDSSVCGYSDALRGYSDTEESLQNCCELESSLYAEEGRLLCPDGELSVGCEAFKGGKGPLRVPPRSLVIGSLGPPWRDSQGFWTEATNAIPHMLLPHWEENVRDLRTPLVSPVEGSSVALIPSVRKGHGQRGQSACAGYG